MSSHIVIGLFGLALFTAACSGSTPSEVAVSSGADRLVLDVRCAADTDCPAAYECEIEVEHGTSQSFCKSHDAVPAGTTPTCPAGFENEAEHGATFCKPHGGSGGGGGSATGGGSGSGGDGGGADDNATPSTSGGTAAAGAACTTNADCASGLECEVELEHGTTTSTCKAHGGKK